MHQKKLVKGGKELEDAKKALLLIHGRGGSAEDILSLANYLNVADYAHLAPEATENSWYPQSFLAPPARNEPWLSSALQRLEEAVEEITAAGVEHQHIYFAGFSQGACLTLEFLARNARQWGGAAAFTGGLIGDTICAENYKGDFGGTPVFIGTSDPDPHVPVERVHQTARQLESMGAAVTVQVYPMMGHTINGDEITQANTLIFT